MYCLGAAEEAVLLACVFEVVLGTGSVTYASEFV